MIEDVDGIIVGAGHNGLILQAYASLAGLRSVSVDRADRIGGGLVTEANPRHPGFLHNTHSFFHRAIPEMPWFRDLELAAHGAEYIEPDLNVAMIPSDGPTLQWWTTFEKTFASFAAIDPEDAKTLRYWHDTFKPIVRDILAPEAASPPLAPEERRRILERSPKGRLLLEVSRLSPLEFVKREFRNPVIQAGLLFFNGLREVDLRQRGFGHHIPALLASPAKAAMVRGGSAGLAHALEKVIRAKGGDLITGVVPRRILVEGGKAVGLELTDGRRFRARHFVASSLNPHQTFLDLLDPQHVPTEWRDRAKAFRYNLLAPLFSLNLALSAPVRYRATEAEPEISKAFMVILGLDHVDQFSDIVRHHEAGTVPPTVMWGASPTVFDPSQAPDGGQTAFMWEKLPFALRGDPTNWDREKDDHGNRLLDLWERHAPGLRDSIVDSFVRSPLDTERELPNMRYGDLLVGAFSNGQVGRNRPFPGAGGYRTCIERLYLCGSACHPGGNITGLPGYNAAQVVLNDLGIEADWMPEPMAHRLA